MRSAGKPRWGEITAVFGGTFDPPHLGHREAVRGLFREPGVKRVLVLPSARPPQKPSNASTEARVAMTRLNFAHLGGDVLVDTREIDRAKRESGKPSFTFDTLAELRRELPGIAFVIGTDQLENLHTWHRFPDLLALSHWIVLERKSAGKEGNDSQNVLSQWVASGLISPAGNDSLYRIQPLNSGEPVFLKRVATPAPDISSTKIRETIGRSGEPPQDRLLPEVAQYLKENRLYGSHAS